MANLTYTVSDFVAFTKIKSAEVNSKFQSIKDYINAKVANGNGTADRVVITDGSGNQALIATLPAVKGGTGTDIDTTGLILKELSTPSTPSSGFGKVYFKSDGFLYQLNDDGSESKVGSGSGGGGTNYVLNPDFESNVANWSVYNDTATFQEADVDVGTDTITVTAHGLLNDDKVVFTSSGTLPAGITLGNTYYIVNKATNTFQISASLGGSVVNLTDDGSGTHMVRPLQPVDATGGSGNITLTRSTTTPLAGVANGLITKDAATRAGEGISTDLGLSVSDLNINREDLAKILQVEFSYEIASGTFTPGSDSSLGDATVHIYDKTNGRRIELSPFKITGGVVGSKYKYLGVFQSDSTSRQYRLAVHNSSASGSAYTIRIDSVKIGPQVKEFGAPITDWATYTPIYTGFGTVSASNIFYRRVGGNLEISGRFTTGTPTAVEARLSLPAGLVSGSTDVIATRQVAGVLAYDSAASASFYTLIESSVGYVTFGFQGAGTGGLNKINGDTFGTTTVLSVSAIVPIAGWSSSLQMSSDADTRVVAAQATGNAASASSGDPIIFPTVTSDTHGAYSAVTGLYTAPVAGYYRVHGFITSSNAAITINIAKNGATHSAAGMTDAGGECSYTGQVKVNAGDLISIEPDGTLDVDAASTLCIERVSGPEQIAASESIAASYTLASNTSITNDTPITFDTKEIDTHGAVSGGRFTAPAKGLYLLTGVLQNSTTSVNFRTYKNSSAGKFLNTLATNELGSFALLMSLVSGDIVDIRPDTTATITGGATASTFQIQRIGI